MGIKTRQKLGGSADDEDPIVYSTHPIKTAAVASVASYSGPIKPAMRIERKGRNGKTVTVLFRLPKHETLLKKLCSYLKKTFGGGGTYSIEKEYGVVEIQGDHSEQILEVVERFARKDLKS
jgi:translation initiation factor 1 (eIF-1/SUI1)